MKDGGPAFPCPSEAGLLPNSGMSLRDYFAATCPSDLAEVRVLEDAVAIAGSQPDKKDFKKHFAWNNRVEAWLRYSYPDAMLAERERREKS